MLTGEQTVLVAQIGNNAIDTLDYLGFWKTLEMAANAAFSGKKTLKRCATIRLSPTWAGGAIPGRCGGSLRNSRAPTPPR